MTNSQTEGIVFTENGSGFVTSENFNFLPPRLLRFNTRQWVGDIITTLDNPISTAEALDLSIFPMPFGDQMTLTWKADYLENGVVEVFDLLGNLVYRQELNNIENRLIIDTANLPKGSYLIRMNDENGIVNKITLRQ